MMKKVGAEASIPNPSLKPFEVLVGQWQTVGSHPYIPDRMLHGCVSFEWIEGGAFLIMHTEVDHPQIPDGVAIFGSDDVEKKFFMLYFDERGISRKYDVSIEEKELKWWRDDPKFSQRVIITMEDDKMSGKGEMSREGSAWERDLELTYERVK